MARIEIEREALDECKLREYYKEKKREKIKKTINCAKIIPKIFCPLLISLGFLFKNEKNKKYNFNALFRDILSGIE